MKYLILTILLITIYNGQAKALEISLVQGNATHFTKSYQYNDSIFKDNLTSTNTLISLEHNNIGLTILADSQGNLSFASTYINKLSKRFSLVSGIYFLRSDKLPSDNLITSFTPSLDIGKRTFSLTPLVGLKHEIVLTNSFSFETLLTPNFILFGLKLSL